MRQHPPRRWQLGRPLACHPRFALPPAADTRMPDPDAQTPPELRAERPGPDGIRHGLVAHVRRLIADGKYDTPERWAAAEAALLRRAEAAH